METSVRSKSPIPQPLSHSKPPTLFLRRNKMMTHPTNFMKRTGTLIMLVGLLSASAYAAPIDLPYSADFNDNLQPADMVLSGDDGADPAKNFTFANGRLNYSNAALQPNGTHATMASVEANIVDETDFFTSVDVDPIEFRFLEAQVRLVARSSEDNLGGMWFGANFEKPQWGYEAVLSSKPGDNFSFELWDSAEMKASVDLDFNPQFGGFRTMSLMGQLTSDGNGYKLTATLTDGANPETLTFTDESRLSGVDRNHFGIKMRQRANGGNDFDVDLDNYTVIVPEPATLSSLMIISGIWALRRRRCH